MGSLAARFTKLRRIPEPQWATESSPTAKVPLAALRRLLHWATSGRLYLKFGSQQQALRAAFEEWGEPALAARIERAGEQDEDSDDDVKASPRSKKVTSQKRPGKNTFN